MNEITKKRKYRANNKNTNNPIQDSQDEVPIGTIFQVNLSNKTSLIKVLVRVECERTYQTEFSTSNLIGHPLILIQHPLF
ncbi:8171_t:CDS:2 [Cetraspora pellucida]|uniref:8171_t:CDS:1 n=1 Tax=Cetraspora pellucida TaxID=1433469 RepID=A0A9N9EQG2_9GLOM|nr:8171_t:CDS:2 [Cetraspora pellucida]